MTAALADFALLTLRLNFRSRQALAYGYLVPLFFLLAFGSVFRSGQPLLLGQMGQLLTITILGGACFGLPTALVAERERGVWRRYRLLPVPLPALVLATLAVRIVIIGLAVLMQLALAHALYGTPWPLHPFQLLGAFLLVSCSFMGLGLVVAALAGDVPAVQALGQCLFLPMIMIGGVGVPLAALPDWAQRVACFMPGRYAVEALQPCFSHPSGLRHAGFSLLALGVIGAAAAIAGLKLFRWDAQRRRLLRSAPFWLGTALAAWLLTGVAAVRAGHIGPVTRSGDESFASITDADVAGITYDNLPDDAGVYTPLAPRGRTRRVPHRIEELITHLADWPLAASDDIGQNVRNLLGIAAIADIGQDHSEAEIARAIYEQLRLAFTEEQLRRALAWVILNPDEGEVIVEAPELGLRGRMAPEIVRERCGWYARKFLGRILGRISDEPLRPDEAVNPEEGKTVSSQRAPSSE